MISVCVHKLTSAKAYSDKGVDWLVMFLKSGETVTLFIPKDKADRIAEILNEQESCPKIEA